MKLGIIGTGKIIHEALPAMEPIKTIEKTAIFARPHSREKGEKLAARFGISEVYTDYDELLAKADIDCVYIGLVNSAHHPYAKAALLAGKHVILEKPFTSTVAEAEDLAALAREKGLFIMEAVTVLHSDLFDKMKESVNKLGPIKLAHANYSQYSSRYGRYKEGKVDPAFNPELSGGALYDINLYNIQYLIALLGTPDEASYFSNKGFNGIDTSGILIMNYPEFTAACTGAKDCDGPSGISLQGEEGYMRLDGKPNVPNNLYLEYIDPDHPELVESPSGGMDRAKLTFSYEPGPVHHRMTREFEDFAKIVDSGDAKEAEACLCQSLHVMKVLEKARKGAGIHFGVDQD